MGAIENVKNNDIAGKTEKKTLKINNFAIIIFTLALRQQRDAVQIRNIHAYEPPRDKTNKVSVRAAKTQISLGIRPVWSVFAVRSMGS